MSPVLLDIFQGVKLLDHMPTLCITFKELFPKVTGAFCISTNIVWGFQFLHFLLYPYDYLSFWFTLPGSIWGHILLWFWSAFPWWLVMHIFLCAYWSLLHHLWRNDCADILPILKWSHWPFYYPICCSVAKSCPTLCDLMDYSPPGLFVPHYLPESAQVHVHWISILSNHLILYYPKTSFKNNF